MANQDAVSSLIMGEEESKPIEKKAANANNYNYGNIRPQGATTGFQVHETPEQGLKAIDDNLKAYGKKNINTLSKIISTWSPPSQNDTPRLIKQAAQRLSLDPNQELDMSSPAVRQALGTAIMMQEGVVKFKKTAESNPEIKTEMKPEAPIATQPEQTGDAVSNLIMSAEPVKEEKKSSPFGYGLKPAEVLKNLKPAAPSIAPQLQPPAVPLQETQADIDARRGLEAIQPSMKVTPKPEPEITAKDVLIAPVQLAGQGVSRAIGATIGGVAALGKDIFSRVTTGKPLTQQEINKTYETFTNVPYEELNPASKKVMEYIAPIAEKLPPIVPGAPEVGLMAQAGKTAQVAKQIEKAIPPSARKPKVTLAEVQAQFQAKKAAEAKLATEPAIPSEPSFGMPETPGVELKRNVDELHQRYESERQAATQGQAAPAESAPGVSGTAKPTTPESKFAELKYAENGLPLDEQYARAQTLNRVLGADHVSDLAAIEGKGKERATNYATSNTDTAQGNFLKERFADEKKRLADFAERQVKNTGGTVGLDESSVYKRGNTILKPLQDLETHFDNATRKIYADRDAIAKDIPVEAQNVMKVLGDESLTLANTETIGLTNIAKARMKQLGMIDKDGNLLPTNAKTAENFRKFLNENYDRKNANLHRKLKEAVDEDVLANLDTNTPLYKDARALVELRKNTLDNPNGIAKILDAEGPNKINRKVQIEKIAQNIADMPVDQFTHVIDTLKSVPPELQSVATKALSEIKAQFANRVAEQNTPRQLTKYMNDNREVMNRLFTPDEMANLRDYHNAVHILATDTGYKGAAVQKINVEQKLSSKIKEHMISKGAALGAEAVTGGTTMGGAALVTNELLSQRAAGKRAKAQAKAEQKAFENTQSRFVPIQDLIKK